jgi:shikimate kinase
VTSSASESQIFDDVGFSNRVIIAGGGGSSFIEKSATHVKDIGGDAPPGNGEIIISG